MTNVVALNGAEIVPPGEPDEDIVAMLEQHLADAKAGKTRAVAVVSVDKEGWVLSGFELSSHQFALLGAMTELQYRVSRYVSENEA